MLRLKGEMGPQMGGGATKGLAFRGLRRWRTGWNVAGDSDLISENQLPRQE